MPSWIAAIFTTAAGAMGTAILALINRTPKFQEAINKSTKALIDSQNEYIQRLEKRIEQLVTRISTLEEALVSKGHAIPPHEEVAVKARKVAK